MYPVYICIQQFDLGAQMLYDCPDHIAQTVLIRVPRCWKAASINRWSPVENVNV